MRKQKQEIPAHSQPPIIKWPGGKGRELPIILKNLPPQFKNYYEPFVGGGSCYLNIAAERYFINDKCEELIGIYKIIKSDPHDFLRHIKQFDVIWQHAAEFVNANKERIIKLYDERKEAEITCLAAELQIGSGFDCPRFRAELQERLTDKLRRISRINLQNLSSTEDVLLNTESAIKSALYNYIRHLTNEGNLPPVLFLSYYYIIRMLAYSGMFRYNSGGKFNVPYGGIAYNKKVFSAKAEYFTSPELQAKFTKTEFHSLDFAEFFRRSQPQENDFIFLDPPYDTEFSTYSNNSFTRDDQERLHDLLSTTKAKWMLIIKETDFISQLYSRDGFNISSFDKKYIVNFKNRNNRASSHLLVRNY